MPGIMQASTQHMPTKPRKAASTCIDCKSKNDTSEKLNSIVFVRRQIAKIMYRVHLACHKKFSSQHENARGISGFSLQGSNEDLRFL